MTVKYKIETVLLHLRKLLLEQSKAEKLSWREIQAIADIKDEVEKEYFVKLFYDQVPEYSDETIKARAEIAKKTIETLDEFISQDYNDSMLASFIEKYLQKAQVKKEQKNSPEGEEEKKEEGEEKKRQLASIASLQSEAQNNEAIPSITSIQGQPPPKFVLTGHVRFCNQDIDYNELMPGKREFAKEEQEKNQKEEQEKLAEMVGKFKLSICCTDAQIEKLVEFLYLTPSNSETWKTQSTFTLLYDLICKNPLNEAKIIDTIVFLLLHPQIYKDNQSSNAFPFNTAAESSLFGASSPDKIYSIFAENALILLKYLQNNQKLRYIYIPMNSLRHFTIKPIQNLKTKYRFYDKMDDVSCMFDLMLGIASIPEIKKSKKLNSLLEALMQSLMDYIKGFSHKNLAVTVAPRNIEYLMKSYGLDTIVETFKGSPKLFMAIIPSIFEVVLLNIKKDTEKANKIAQSLKEIEKAPEDQRENLLQSIEISTEFTDVIKAVTTTVEFFFNYLFRTTYLFWRSQDFKDKVDKETYKIIGNSLKNIRKELEQEELQFFMLEIYEILDIYHRLVGKQNFNYDFVQSKKAILSFTSFAIYLYAIIEMKYRLDQEIVEDEDSSPMPRLSKMVTRDFSAATEGPQKMQRTFTNIKREGNFDFDVIFTNFAIKYNKIIASLCLNNENEALGGLILLLSEKYPFLLINDVQRSFIKKMFKEQFFGGYEPDRRETRINRDRVIESLAERLENLDRTDLMRVLNVSFENESGIDAGGLTRDLYTLLTHELFDVDKGLFRLAGNGLSIQPRPDSAIIPNHLKLFELAGIVVAKAIISDVVLECNFTKSFLKHILGRKIAIADLNDLDSDLAKNTKWTLENDVEDLGLTFSYDTQILGQNVTKELVEGGFDVDVTEQNKKEYVMKLCEALMTKEIGPQLESFLKGFRAVIPQRFMLHLSPSDLGLIISGTPTIDLEDMKKHCRYENFSEDSDLAKWIWEILGEFTQEQLASFLYFVSGSVKVPAGGFQNKPVVFKVLDYINVENLPIAHTCFYTLDMPNYQSKEKVREKFLLGLFEGKEGFFIA